MEAAQSSHGLGSRRSGRWRMFACRRIRGLCERLARAVLAICGASSFFDSLALGGAHNSRLVKPRLPIEARREADNALRLALSPKSFKRSFCAVASSRRACALIRPDGVWRPASAWPCAGGSSRLRRVAIGAPRPLRLRAWPQATAQLRLDSWLETAIGWHAPRSPLGCDGA